MKPRIACITPVSHIPGLYERLNELGDLYYNPYIDKSEIWSLLTDNSIDIIFTNPNKQGFVINELVLMGSPVKIIATASTGLNHIDMDYCNWNNIKVISITEERKTLQNIPSTAEHAFGLMMAIIRNTFPAMESVKRGKWDWEPFIGRQLSDMKVGIVGFGRLGQMMGSYCRAFGSEVFLYDPIIPTDYLSYYGCTPVGSLEELCDEVDIISLHVHVKRDTIEMINESLIEKFNSPKYIVNTSRGEIVNEHNIIEGIHSGKIAGYATDTLTDEFNNIQDSPIYTELMNSYNSNVIVTPHLGGSTMDAQKIAYNKTVDLLEECL